MDAEPIDRGTRSGCESGIFFWAAYPLPWLRLQGHRVFDPAGDSRAPRYRICKNNATRARDRTLALRAPPQRHHCATSMPAKH